MTRILASDQLAAIGPFILAAAIVAAFVLYIRYQSQRQAAAFAALVRQISGGSPTGLWSKAGSATGSYRGHTFGLYGRRFNRGTYGRIAFVATDAPVLRFAARHEMRGFFETPYGKHVDSPERLRRIRLTSDEPEALERALASGLTERLASTFDEPTVGYSVSIAPHDARRVRFEFGTYRGPESSLLILGRFFRGGAEAAADPRLDLDALIALEQTLQSTPVGDAERAAIPAPTVLFASSLLRIILGVLLTLVGIAAFLWFFIKIAG